MMQKQGPEILVPLIKELERYLTLKDKRNDSISTSNVAWQIDHTLKVFNLVSKTLLESNPKLYTSKFNKWRLLFFTLEYFPRGKVKAPKFVRPPENITTNDLEIQLKKAFQNIEQIKTAHKNAHFKHFIFGVLNTKRTTLFLKLHTTHHLKIIRDILK